MNRHHLDNRLYRRRNRCVRLFGQLHFFRVNVPGGAFTPWWVND
jgi:hypothetical protein